MSQRPADSHLIAERKNREPLRLPIISGACFQPAFNRCDEKQRFADGRTVTAEAVIELLARYSLVVFAMIVRRFAAVLTSQFVHIDVVLL